MMREGISFATGLRWHIATGKRDRQLIAAAKKGRLNHSPLVSINHSQETGGHVRQADERIILDAAPRELEETEEPARLGIWVALGFQEDEISVVEALELGADVNAAEVDGNTALHYACEEGYHQLLEFLLSCEDISIDVTAAMDWTPLHCAANKGRVEAITLLAQQGGDLHRSTRDGNTALHIAAMGGHFEAVKVLTELGCDTKCINDDFHTASDVAGLFQNGEFKRIIDYMKMPCTSPDGQRTSLCAQTFESFALEIRLVKGRNVVCMDVVKQSDAYVTFRFNNPPGFLRSRTVKRSAAPTWNQILLHRINLAPQVMQLELWDEHFGEADDHFIGAASVNLKPIILNTKAYLDAGGIDDDLDKNDKYPRLHQDVEMKLQKHNNKIQGIVTIVLRILRIPEKFACRAN